MGILDGKIAIITGAGQGRGEGAAHAMTQEGACVALWGRTFEKVERVANDINKAGGRALAIKCDVSIRAEVDEALKKTIEAFGNPGDQPLRFRSLWDDGRYPAGNLGL